MAVSLRHPGFSRFLRLRSARSTSFFNGGSARSFSSGFPFLNLSTTPAQAHAHSASSHPSSLATSAAYASQFLTGSTGSPLSFLQPRARTATASPVDATPLPTFPCEKSAINRLFKQNTAASKERAFFINDVGVLERQFARWEKNLPNTRPFYAVKCSPDQTLLRVMASLGAGFDCASGEEMSAVLKMGVPAHDIIFANPIKNMKDLQYAAKMNVNKMTFDNEAELYKIKEHHPKAELVLRLLPDDSGSVMRFGVKFGAPLVHVEGLLKTAHSLGLKVIGTSFHIGSGCFDANSYDKAIALSRSVHDMAPRLGMSQFTLMDIGGGFPGSPIPNHSADGACSFEDMAVVINAAQAKYFPASSGVECIAEPGRYMATAWSTLFTLVQGKREEPVPQGSNRKFLYYINDGVYGSFNNIMFDHATPEPVPAYRFMNDKLSLERPMPVPSYYENYAQSTSAIPSGILNYGSDGVYATAGARAYHSKLGRDDTCTGTFFGPTCDSMDVVAKDYPIEELFVGDWLAFKWSGAYTNAAASTFNGMPKPTVQYCRSQKPSPDAE